MHASPRGRICEPGASAGAADGSHSVELVSGCTLSLGPGTTDERIRAIAAAQRGRAGRKQLLSAGIDRHAIDRRVADGRLVREHNSVYAMAPVIELPLAAETGALLAARGIAWLADHSAATLWGLRPGQARPIQLVVPATRRGPVTPDVTVHRSRILTPRDVTVHRGLPVTSPARTILDIAPRLGDRGLALVIAEAFAARLTTEPELRKLVDRAGRHPGRGMLERVLATDDLLLTESDNEEILLGLIGGADLPMPETQVYVLGYRLDFLWRGLKLGAEVDTYGTHGSREKFESDRRRDARLLAEANIRMLRFTGARIRHAPLEVVAQLARAIATA